MVLNDGFGAIVSIGVKLQIQNEISYSSCCLESLQKSVKQLLNKKNNCLFILLAEGKEITSFYKNHCQIITEYGLKNNPFYGIVVNNNFVIKEKEETSVQNLIISNRCQIKLKIANLVLQIQL